MRKKKDYKVKGEGGSCMGKTLLEQVRELEQGGDILPGESILSALERHHPYVPKEYPAEEVEKKLGKFFAQLEKVKKE
jgi:hypothetical protein